jgi:uncharacterized protein (TIGR04255 family)
MTSQETAAADLPDFDEPPVVEVALSVGFQALPRFTAVDFGLFWERSFAGYPNISHQPPQTMPVERFDRVGGSPQVSWELATSPPLPRVWFVDDGDANLVQVQPNWFARNWRKTDSGGTYPHYQAIRELFVSDLAALLAFAGDRKLGEFRATQCEVTYINHVPFEGDVGQLHDVVRVLGQPPASDNQLETTRLALQFTVGTPPVARLHITGEEATRLSDAQRIAVLSITFRGAPSSGDVDGVLSFLDRGHVEIVRAFDSLTTDPMHAIWKRRDRR